MAVLSGWRSTVYDARQETPTTLGNGLTRAEPRSRLNAQATQARGEGMARGWELGGGFDGEQVDSTGEAPFRVTADMTAAADLLGGRFGEVRRHFAAAVVIGSKDGRACLETGSHLPDMLIPSR